LISVWVTPPFPEDLEGDRRVEFRQTLDSFLEGGEFSVAENPYAKPSNVMLARVDPVTSEIWDIRSIAPTPGIRCLGVFVDKDTFVALTWNYRENLEEPGEWEAEINRFTSDWRELFGDVEPYKGDCLDDYLTNYHAV
jgi:hypothetical protein